jgi:predicted lipoprotein
MRKIIAFALFFATPAYAGVTEVINDHIRPGFDRFAAQTQALSAQAQQDCQANAMQPAFHAAYDAWMGISHLHFGPLERDGRALTISFWPDKKGKIARKLAKQIADQDPVVHDAQRFAQASIAGRGLMALEQMLYEPRFNSYGRQDYSCALVQAISGDLALMARQMRQEWGHYGYEMLNSGPKTRFRDLDEVVQEIYTALLTGLEYNWTQRLGRPLGSFDKPRPQRAEARRSGRSLRNVMLSLGALQGLSRALYTDPAPLTQDAFDDAFAVAQDLPDGDFAQVSDVMGRLRVEILAQRIEGVYDAVAGEIGAAMGLSAGFNSLDGD